MKQVLFFVLLVLCFSCGKNEVQKLLEEGENYLDEKNYSSALISFQDAISQELEEEQKIKAWRNISLCFENMNQADSTNFYRVKALKNVEKGSYWYYILKGEDFVEKDKLDNAEEWFKNAEKLDAEGLEALNNLSLLYSGVYDDKHMNLSKALTYAKKATKLKSSTVNQEQLAAVYFQLENFKEAGEIYRKLFNKHPNIRLYQFNWGQCLYFSDDEINGIDLMEEAATRDLECQELLEEIRGTVSDEEK